MLTEKVIPPCPFCVARERRAMIVQMRADGLTFRAIGEKLGGMKRQTIYRAWKKEASSK